MEPWLCGGQRFIRVEATWPSAGFGYICRHDFREDAVVRAKAVYLALAVLPDGSRDILGFWIENTEGAKFGMKVFNAMKSRGVHDVLIAVTDGLQGMAFKAWPRHWQRCSRRRRCRPASCTSSATV